MRAFASLAFLLFVCACATTQKPDTRFDTPLKDDFLRADDIMTGHFSLAAFNELRMRLHSRLRAEGDDSFSATLSKIPEMKQVSVVNVMGFMNPSEYDRFPKTQYILAAAPKI